jgi:hypothetical protein
VPDLPVRVTMVVGALALSASLAGLICAALKIW